MENKIRKVMKSAKNMCLRDLKRKIHASRSGSFIFSRSLLGLQQAGEIQVATPKIKFGNATKTIVVWHGEGEE